MSDLTFEDFGNFLNSINLQPTAFYCHDKENDCLVEQTLDDKQCDCFVCFSVDKNNDPINQSTITTEDGNPIYCLDVYNLDCDLCSMSSNTQTNVIEKLNHKYLNYLASNNPAYLRSLDFSKSSLVAELGCIDSYLERLKDSDVSSAEKGFKTEYLNHISQKIRANMKFIDSLKPTTPEDRTMAAHL